MENRYEQNPEERQEWGAYATPPPTFRLNAEKLETQQNSPATLCARVQEMLPSLVENDGAIRPEMAAALFAHLAVCPSCAKEFEEMQRTVAVLNTLPEMALPMDFSGVIMQRIEREMPGLYTKQDASFAYTTIQEIVTETQQTETQKTQTRHDFATVSQLQHTTVETNITQSSLNLWQRVVALGAFFATLLLFLSSGWGRATLGANLVTAREWLRQITQATEDIPLLGWVTGQAFAVLSQSLHILEETYRTLGASAMKGLFVDMVVATTVYMVLNGRKSQARKTDLGGH